MFRCCVLAVSAAALLLSSVAESRTSEARLKEILAAFQRDFGDIDKRTDAIRLLGEADHPKAVKILLKLLARRDKQAAPLAAKRARKLAELDKHLRFLEQASDRGRTFSTGESDRLRQKTHRLEREVTRLDKQVTAIRFIRFSAIRALSQTEDHEALALIHEACSHARWEVQTGALIALTRCGQVSSRPVVRALLAHEDPKVAAAALDTAGSLEDLEAFDAVVAQLHGGKTWQIRLAATMALGRLNEMKGVRPLLKAVPPLIEAIGKEDGRLREDMDQVLEAITGFTHGGDGAAWQRWYAGVKDQLAEVVAARTRVKKKARPVGKSVSFYGIPTRSKRLCFVIDVSGSMRQETGLEDDEPSSSGSGSVEKDPNYPIDGTKMEVANYELCRAIKALPPDARFNIVYFSTLVNVYGKAMVTASPANKARTIKWIGETLKPSMMTNIFDALDTAMTLSGPKLERNLHEGVDTIFFLTDGMPTHGRIRDRKKMLQEIGLRNRLRKIKIHVIGVGQEGELDLDFLRRLADRNDGTFVQRR